MPESMTSIQVQVYLFNDSSHYLVFLSVISSTLKRKIEEKRASKLIG